MKTMIARSIGVTALLAGCHTPDNAAAPHAAALLTTLTVPASADATVRAGAWAGDNFGGDPHLVVKTTAAGNGSLDRWSFLKFDLSGVSPPVATGRLRVRGALAPGGTGNVRVIARAVDDTSWREDALTWNNSPGSSGVLGVATVDSTVTDREWDLSDLVRGALAAGRAAISVALGALDSNEEAVQFDAREAGATGPALLVTAGDAPAAGPTIAGCPAFPADDEWNRRVADDPVDPDSDAYLAGMRASAHHLTADFGDGWGLPWVSVPGSQPRVPVTFDYDTESDPGPYPIPADAPIERSLMDDGGDRHVLVVDRDACRLYEMWHSRRAGGGWHAGAGAAFDLRTNDLRPERWTSADAAGLPILPGLIRREEVLAGRIAHALRFTVGRTQAAYVFPARHFASSSRDPSLPPMGLRVRLRAGFDVSGFGPEARVVLTALKEYGMFVADNGPDWYVSGEVNDAWDADSIRPELARVPATAFEVVAHGPVLR